MSTARMVCIGTALALIGVAGCGGGGVPSPSGGGAPGAAPETVALGSLQVGVASAAGFRTLPLQSPDLSRIGFTVLYGTRIVRLAEVGYTTLAFESNRSGNYEIWRINTDGTERTNLSKNPADDWYPAWSPDGQKVAFTSNRNGNLEIYVMNANGTSPVNLTRNASDDRMPDWSPDGRKIAFASQRDGNFEIYTMNANGSGQKRLTNSVVWELMPAWSPDGRAIAYTTEALDSGIHVMGADGSDPVSLSSEGAYDTAPAWSPDGRTLAFASFRDADYEIYTMQADGSGVRQVTNNALDDGGPSWSPDGLQIATHAGTSGADIFVANADGSDPVNVTQARGVDGDPAWYPRPGVKRVLVGAAGSDGGSDPPFGLARPLVVVGLTGRGLVSAATIQIPEANWPSIRAESVTGIGREVAGLKVTAASIVRILEDLGRGLAPRQWTVQGSPSAGAVLVFFSTMTGRVTTVIAASDVALGSTDAAAQLAGARINLRGRFTEVYSAADPRRNLISGSAQEIQLDARTGEVAAVH